MPSVNFKEFYHPNLIPPDKYMNPYHYGHIPSYEIKSRVLYTLSSMKGLSILHIFEEVLGVDLLSDEMIYLLYKNLRSHQELHCLDDPWRVF